MMVSNLNDNETIPVETGEQGGNATGSAFPLARVKKIIKADKDVNLVSAEAVQLTSIAAELFLELLVKKATDVSQAEKRRTILYKDFANTVKQDPRFGFLTELIPETVSVQAALEAQRSRGLPTSAISAPHSPVSSRQQSVDDVSMASGRSTAGSASITDFFAKKTMTTANEVDIEDDHDVESEKDTEEDQ